MTALEPARLQLALTLSSTRTRAVFFLLVLLGPIAHYNIFSQFRRVFHETLWSHRIVSVYSPADPNLRLEGFFSAFELTTLTVFLAEGKNALGVSVFINTSLYLEPARGPNWWAYYFQEPIWFNTTPISTEPSIVTWDYVLNITPPKLGDPQPGEAGGNTAAKFVATNRTVHKHVRLLPALVERTVVLSRDVLGVTPRLPGLFALADPGGELSSEQEERKCLQSRNRSERVHECAAFKLAVHYRGTDNYGHVPYEIFSAEIDAVLARAGVGGGECAGGSNSQKGRLVLRTESSVYEFSSCDYVIFVATDEAAFLTFMRYKYGTSKVRSQPNVPRSLDRKEAMHRNPAIPGYKKGETVLMDALLMSQCNYLIRTRSSVSGAALTFSPLLPFSYIHYVPPFNVDREPAWET